MYKYIYIYTYVYIYICTHVLYAEYVPIPLVDLQCYLRLKAMQGPGDLFHGLQQDIPCCQGLWMGDTSTNEELFNKPRWLAKGIMMYYDVLCLLAIVKLHDMGSLVIELSCMGFLAMGIRQPWFIGWYESFPFIHALTRQILTLGIWNYMGSCKLWTFPVTFNSRDYQGTMCRIESTTYLPFVMFC